MTDEERRARNREYQRQWRERHPEKKREQSRKWRQEHPEKIRKYARDYYRRNREVQRGNECAVVKSVPDGCVYPDCFNCPLPDCEWGGV